jgi:hypothetical protein
VFELAPHAFDQIRPLIRASKMRGHLALVYEVLEGHRPGLIFVDSSDLPHTAFLCSSSGFFFAFGEPDQTITDDIIVRFWHPGQDENYTTLFGSSPAWNATLQRAFTPYGSRLERRLAFELKSMPELPTIPEGYSLQPITAGMAQSILDGSGTGGFGIDPWFIRSAGGPQAYASLNLGLALVCEGSIASICGICGLGGGEAELEVGTVPDQRQRGLATIVSAAFMHQCRERGLHPAYSCSKDNNPSISVAHRLGFVEIEEIQGYQLYEERPGK